MSLHKLLNEKTKSLGTLVDEGKSTDLTFSRSFKVGSIQGELLINLKDEDQAAFVLAKGDHQHQVLLGNALEFTKEPSELFTAEELKKLNKVFVPIINRLKSTPKLAKFL